MFSPVGEEIEHSKTSRKLRKKVSHQLDEPEDGVDENRNSSNEPSSNCDVHGDSYNKNEIPKGVRGKKTSTKSSKPSSDNEKPTRKRKDANKAVPDLQAEKRPKKFSHSTRRNRRQGTISLAADTLNRLQLLCMVNVETWFCQIINSFLPFQ